MANNITLCELEDWKKHGILHCGYYGCYAVAEAFMRKVASIEFDPSLEIMLALDGKNFNLDDAHYDDFLNSEFYARTDAVQRIYRRCVEKGDFFESFLKVCAETKLLDPWFMSEEFMSNVWAGSIHGYWSIPMQGETSKEPYRNRFRKFIQSLDDRGLKWTEKYLEPDPFWKQKEVYWKDEK